jgi:hypothetical protein
MRPLHLALALTALAAPLGAVSAMQAAPPAPTAPAVAPAASDDPDQVVRCRRMEVTGSLVRRVRVCKTIAEWRRMANQGEGEARDYVDFNRGRPSGEN